MKKWTYSLVQSNLACAHGRCRQEPVLVCSWVPVHRQCLCTLQGMRVCGWCEQHHGTVLMSPAECLYIPPKPACTAGAVHHHKQVPLAVKRGVHVHIQIHSGEIHWRWEEVRMQESVWRSRTFKTTTAHCTEAPDLNRLSSRSFSGVTIV